MNSAALRLLTAETDLISSTILSHSLTHSSILSFVPINNFVREVECSLFDR